jgi:hypothetical protein
MSQWHVVTAPAAQLQLASLTTSTGSRVQGGSMQNYSSARYEQTRSVRSTESIRSRSSLHLGSGKKSLPSTRSQLLVSSGLAALLFSAVVTAQPAYASCSVSVGGTIVCGTTVTTATTNINGVSGISSDATQLFNNNVPITASISAGASITGAGLSLVEGSAINEFISLVNNTGSSILGTGPGASLYGNGGNVFYSGAGSVTGTIATGILASNIGAGQISIVTTGLIAAGDNLGGDNYGILTTAANGLTTIDLTGGAGIIGASADGMLDSAGIHARSLGGGIAITSAGIGSLGDLTGIGIDAAITGAGAGIIQVSALGDIFADSTAISAINNNTGGIAVTLNTGAKLTSGTYGEYLRVTGAGGGITVTNAVGSFIDPLIGVDAQIVNNADTSNVTIHQNGTLVADVTGIIAATNGTGSVLVDGSGAVTGGSGFFSFSNLAAPASASNIGIFAQNNGTAGGVTVSGAGTTSGNLAIAAIISNGVNSSNILVDRSGSLSVTGIGGVGVLARTAGLGTVTVRNTGAITGASVLVGIDAEAAGGNVLVQNVGAITANAGGGYGIYAVTNGVGTATIDGTSTISAAGTDIYASTDSGDILVTHTGALSGTGGVGINTASNTGNIVITPGATVSNAWGVYATTGGAGDITITTALGAGGNITGTAAAGIYATLGDGDITVTNNAALIQGATSGAETIANGSGVITITGSGNYAGGGKGISAVQNGIGPGTGFYGIVVSGTGNTSATVGTGIDARILNGANHSDILVNRTGTVTTSGNGILASTMGDGNVSVINSGTVIAGPGQGILAASQGGNILVTPASTVSGGTGIYATTSGAGSVTVTTAFNAAGNITGTSADGVDTTAENGNTIVTNNAAQISGTAWAGHSLATGLGSIVVQGAGNYVGGTGGGIYAEESGIGPAAGNNGILIAGTGTTSATTGIGIDALITNVGNHANILVNRTGAVSVLAGGGSGIVATTLGDGNVTVTGVLGVTAGTGSSAIGIDAESHGGTILVTPAGAVSGGNGIAGLTSGAGSVTVTTIAGAAGNVTGSNGYGVATLAQNGNTIVNNNAVQISGTTWASESTSSGTGTITVQGAGNYVGGTSGGILAQSTGAGPGNNVTGILITGSGTTTATIGSGIVAQMTIASNHSDILINRTGNVTVQAGGGSGIVGTTAGDGDVTVIHVGNVQAGTGSGSIGINAQSGGGAVLVDLTSPINATSTVSGGNGIQATTLGSGAVTVTTYTGTQGNITGVNGYGVQTGAADGNTTITNNATTIQGSTWGSWSDASGFGVITVQGSGDYVGGSSGGIYARNTGAGPGSGFNAIHITGSGNTSATTGPGINTVILSNLNASDILIDRTGTVTVGAAGGPGVSAFTLGTGNVTITGVGNVQAGTSGTARGIQALASGGNILITPAGTVSGAIGIGALATGAGTVTITTASGAAGNVTGVVGNGIAADVVDGAAVITNNAATVSGATSAGRGISNGLGTLTITGAGNYVGGSVSGIWASASGTGPLAGNDGIVITGSGNTSATTGIGILAEITNASNASDILVDRSGTVSVAAGGGDGIYAYTVGTGNVTVTGVGNVTAGTSAGTIGIDAEAAGGDVSVLPAGTVIGGRGIYASTTLSGAVTVTTAGDVTGTDSHGIEAYSVDGDIDITTAVDTAVASLGTGDGIHAAASGLGNITILADSTVSADPGIYATTAFGNIMLTENATVTGLLDGIFAQVTNPASSGWINITGTGDVFGGTNGIEAAVFGSGDVTISGSGNTTASGGDGIIAQTATGNILIDRTGTVSGTTNGISAVSLNGGSVTVDGVGDVTGGAASTGILAQSTAGDVWVAPGGTVSAGTGIGAYTGGSGSVTVITASGAAGNVTGTSADGIDTIATDGDTLITNNAALVSGSAAGAYALSGGLGTITINGSGTYSGGTDDGIIAISTGLGPVGGGDEIVISGDGNTTSTSGTGIYAAINNPLNDSNIVVSRSGTVDAGDYGIIAHSYGAGDISVTGTGNVTAGIGGILAESFNGGDVLITPAGWVHSVSFGIAGVSTFGGTVTVTTASGAAGNVISSADDGIATVVTDGNSVVTNNATTVSGTGWAVRSRSNGIGTITITGPGTYAGGSSGGIYARSTGGGPAAGQDQILISGTGNTSATTGYGILATVTNPSNAGNIHITRSGTVGVAAGGLDGIRATTVGSGDIVITGVGNVVAGTGATQTGIFASAVGGDVTISSSGTAIGGGRGIDASTNAGGTISVTAADSVTGTALDGILTSAVDGDTLVTINGGTTSASVAGYAAVNEMASGLGNLGVVVASGAAVSGGTTTTGVMLVQSGTGNNAVTNTGLITGAGTAAGPVIYVSATGTQTNTITNNVGGVIQSANATANNRPADLAIFTPVATGAFIIRNYGTLNGQIYLSDQVNTVTNTGTWNLRDNGASGYIGAAFGSSGSNSLINSTGTINAGNALATATTTFSGLNILTNGGTINAGLWGSSDVTTFTASGGSQMVTNTGTFNVHGLLAFAGSSTFNNAGGLIDMRTSGSATTDLVTLNTTVTGGGATHLSNTYVPGVAYNFAGGTNSRLGLDTHVGAASSTGASVPSDRLLISGNATSTTGILINDTNSGSGSYNPVGITLVAVNGTSSNAFTLAGVTSSANTDVLQASRGPLGAIKKGFWFYPLLQTTHATAAADGLSGANSTEYRLYGLPDVEAFELGLAGTGAENVWYETTQAITERQQEIRDDWNYGRTNYKPALWVKITGSWTSRTMPLQTLSSYAALAGVLPGFDTSFDQDTFAIQLGADKAYSHVFSAGDALVVGAGAGYVTSKLKFTSSRNAFDYSGATLHGSVDYYNGPFFLDVLVKGDLLTLDYKFGTLSPFAYSSDSTAADSWGVMSSAGLHFPFSHTRLYFEPMLTIAYQESGLDAFSALGTTADFTQGDTLRGAIGGRLGGVLNDDENSYLMASLTGRYWDEFSNHTGLVLSSSGPAIALDDMHREKGFGEVSGRLSLSGKNWGGWSGYISSGAKFNSAFTTVNLNGGVRFQW